MLVLLALAVGLHAEESTLISPRQPRAALKALSFPPNQYMGRLIIELETGPLLDPKALCFSGTGEDIRTAQGEVLVPAERQIQLVIGLALNPHETARLRLQNPQSYQMLIAARTRKNPDDLSGLWDLGPNDLFGLSVGSVLRGTGDPRPGLLKPIHHLTGLQRLRFVGSGIGDKDLDDLMSLRALRALEFSEEPRISSRGLARLKDLPALEYLDLHEGVTDAGLRQVACVSTLRWLRIRTGRIWGPGLAALAQLAHLERLCLWGSSPITDRHLQYLESLTQLKSLTLWGVAASLSDASLASIAKLRSLEDLYFIRTSPRFTVTGASHLRHLKKLKRIDFAQACWGMPPHSDADTLVAILAELPQLESIEHIRFVSAQGMESLGTMKNLKCLDVGLKDPLQGYQGPTGLTHLVGLDKLEALSLSCCAATLSDTDMAALGSLTHLKELYLDSQSITAKQLANIGKLKQLERLDLACPLNCEGLNQLNGLSNLKYLKVKRRTAMGESKITKADELTLDLSGLKRMKDICLMGVSLQENDLAFLQDLSQLEEVTIFTDSLSGTFMRHLKGLTELDNLRVSGLSSCAGQDLANLGSLPKLSGLNLTGNITDTCLKSFKGPVSLASLSITTDHPIRVHTVDDLRKDHPTIEFIHKSELPKLQTRPVQQQERSRASQPRTGRRAPAKRRR